MYFSLLGFIINVLGVHQSLSLTYYSGETSKVLLYTHVLFGEHSNVLTYCSGEHSKVLPYTHVLDLAAEGFIMPHIDSVRVIQSE